MASDGRARSRGGRAATMAIMLLLIGFGSIGWRWYTYVTAGESPYDEVGIELNRRLPEPLRTWGCSHIKDRFPGSVPPLGC